MPPRFVYWTIIAGGQATAFRAATPDELLPTLKQLQSKQPDAVMMWFARGKLWPSEEAAAMALRLDRQGFPGKERRGRDWRPGGEHQDPRDRFKVPRDVKRQRFAAKARRDRVEGQPPREGPGDRPFRPREDRPRPDRPTGPRSERPASDQPFRPRDERPGGGRPVRPREERPAGGGPFRPKPGPGGDRPFQPKEGSRGDRPYRPKEGLRSDRPYRPKEAQRTERPVRPKDGQRTDRTFRPTGPRGGGKPGAGNFRGGPAGGRGKPGDGGFRGGGRKGGGGGGGRGPR